MHFLEENQIEEWCTERNIDPNLQWDDGSTVILRKYFGQTVDPRGQEREVAVAAADALGQWDECLLWVTQWGIWGSSEDWPRYYAARGAIGERRSLEKAPGHLFEAHESHAFETFLQLVLENAWDAAVIAAMDGKSTGRRVRVSHDEYIEVLANADSSSNSRLQPA